MKISEIEKGSDLVVKVFPKVMKDGVEIRSMRSLDFAVNVQKVYATAIAVDEIKTTSVPAPGGKQGDKKDKGMATVSFQSTKAFICLRMIRLRLCGKMLSSSMRGEIRDRAMSLWRARMA